MIDNVIPHYPIIERLGAAKWTGPTKPGTPTLIGGGPPGGPSETWSGDPERLVHFERKA